MTFYRKRRAKKKILHNHSELIKTSENIRYYVKKIVKIYVFLLEVILLKKFNKNFSLKSSYLVLFQNKGAWKKFQNNTFQKENNV